MAQGFGSYFRYRKGVKKGAKKQAPENGTWYVWYPDARGRKQPEKTLCRTKGEADVRALELAQRSERQRKGIEAAGPVPTFGEAARLYRESIKHLASYSDVDAQLRRIERSIGNLLMSEVTPANLDTMVSEHRDALQPSTLRGLLVRVGAVYHWANRKARLYRGDNPAQEATPVRVPERLPRVLTLAQLERLLSAMSSDWDAFLFAALTGARKGEVAGLPWELVDLEKGLATIRYSYDKPTTKGAKDRVVPLPPELVQVLRKKKRTATSRWVFPNPKGGMRTETSWDAAENFKAALRKAGLVKGYRHHCRRTTCREVWESPNAAPTPCAKCGYRSWPTGIELPFTFKDLRSTFATYMAESGGIRVAQLLLGHTRPEVTARHYDAGRLEHLRQAVEASPLGRYAMATSDGAGLLAPSQPKKKGQ